MCLPVHKQYTVGTRCKNMDDKKLLIPFWYNFECTIYDPGFDGYKQFNVIRRRKHQYMLLHTFRQQKRFPRLHSSKFIGNDCILMISWMSGRAFGPLAVDCIPDSLKNGAVKVAIYHQYHRYRSI
ncbi:hypothetical protein T10_3726 [Trichinella papuae]|uniref:Uncharacterized protein n=1 Tax=Trichinella papuae TaxID=268474 RepID=A0A0V1MT96_9BILA|nr:hypothetical protein T10_3726 [Trichinella papuae]